MMNELKPCPFCGGKKICINNFGFHTYNVECLLCHAETNRFGIEPAKWDVEELRDKGLKDAIKAWNRRADNA